jgi:hypothetical protein
MFTSITGTLLPLDPSSASNIVVIIKITIMQSLGKGQRTIVTSVLVELNC